MSNPQNKLKFQAVLDALETKQTKKKSDSLKAKRSYAEEMRKASPQDDILRFGKKQKAFRDLGRKETVVTEVNDDDDNVKSIQYLPRPGAELFRKQERAYGDSLKLAGLAQQYGRTTVDVRKIDRNQDMIKSNFNTNVQKHLNDTPGFAKESPKNAQELAKKKAIQDLIKKHGKGIIPLLADVKNR